MLKLYVWRDFRTDYTPGIAFAVADSVDRARDLILTEHANTNYEWARELVQKDLRQDPEVFEGEAAGFVWGGS